MANQPPRNRPYTVSDNFPNNERPSDRDQREWLHRSNYWREPLRGARHGGNWKPVGILGGGAYGIVGRFDYDGDPTRQGNYPNSIAVKQSTPEKTADLEMESEILKRLMFANSDHIIHLYKECYYDAGTGAIVEDRRNTREDRDPLSYDIGAENIYVDNKEVARIYLEYCPNLDLQGGIRKQKAELNENGNFMPEEDVWRLFLCLAKAALLLDTGSEDHTAPRPDWRQVLHMDIKPQNILIGSRTPAGGRHAGLNGLKLTDFGVSIVTPVGAYGATGDQPLSVPFTKSARWRGTFEWVPPEQRYLNHQERRHYQKLNVWPIAAVIYNLIFGEDVDDQRRFQRKTAATGNKKLISWMGEHVYSKYGPNNPKNLDVPYSDDLISLLLRCLYWHPPIRPTTTQLVNQIETKLRDDYTPAHIPPAAAVPTSDNLVAIPRPWQLPAADVTFSSTYPEANGPARHKRFEQDLPETWHHWQDEAHGAPPPLPPVIAGGWQTPFVAAQHWTLHPDAKRKRQILKRKTVTLGHNIVRQQRTRNRIDRWTGI